MAEGDRGEGGHGVLVFARLPAGGFDLRYEQNACQARGLTRPVDDAK